MGFNFKSAKSYYSIISLLVFDRSCERRSSKGKIGEIELFRAVMDSFDFYHKECVAEEFHQKAKVKFKPCGPYKKSSKFITSMKNYVECELSDIYLVSFDENSREIKHTFIQAKYDSKNDLEIILKNGSFADLHQWDLLRRRPKLITGKFKGKKILPNILKDAQYNTVGSYMFFSKEYDFIFFDASRLKPLSSAPAARAVVKYNSKTQDETVRLHDIERHVSANSLEFYQHVYDFKIGSPVTTHNEKLFLKNILTYTKSIRDEGTTGLIDEILNTSLQDIPFNENDLINPETDLPAKFIIIVKAMKELSEMPES